MDEPRTNRGRPRYGDPPKPKVIKFSTSLPPDTYNRIEKYCADEERDKAWVIKHAVDDWLKDRGY